VDLQDYLDKLKAFNWKDYNIYYAVLFGSLAKKGKGNDIDIAVEFKVLSFDDYMKLWKGSLRLLGYGKDRSCFNR
jgi:hypothetical protein